MTFPPLTKQLTIYKDLATLSKRVKVKEQSSLAKVTDAGIMFESPKIQKGNSLSKKGSSLW